MRYVLISTMDLLKVLWRKWLKIARIIGNFQGQVILSVFYFLLVWPLGIFFRFFSDPLNIGKQKRARSNFEKWVHPKDTLGTARRQY